MKPRLRCPPCAHAQRKLEAANPGWDWGIKTVTKEEFCRKFEEDCGLHKEEKEEKKMTESRYAPLDYAVDLLMGDMASKDSCRDSIYRARETALAPLRERLKARMHKGHDKKGAHEWALIPLVPEVREELEDALNYLALERYKLQNMHLGGYILKADTEAFETLLAVAELVQRAWHKLAWFSDNFLSVEGLDPQLEPVTDCHEPEDVPDSVLDEV